MPEIFGELQLSRLGIIWLEQFRTNLEPFKSYKKKQFKQFRYFTANHKGIAKCNAPLVRTILMIQRGSAGKFMLEILGELQVSRIGFPWLERFC